MSRPALQHAALASRPIDVTVSHSAQPTVFARLCVEFSRHLVDARRRGRVGVAAHVFPLRSYRHPDPHGHVPDVVVPIVSRADVTVAEQVTALRSYPERALVAEVNNLARYTRAWEPAAREPRRWLDGYADATWSHWQGFEPTWRRARHLIDRETERIGVAAVRGGLAAALNTTHRRLRFEADTLWLDRARRIPLDGRRLILVPGLIPDDGLLIHDGEPDVLSVAYSVRGHGGVRPRPARPASERLALVLGNSRAALLQLLEIPRTVGELAGELDVSPGAVSRHCDQLEQAGLISRDRRGRSVQVSRTEEGHRVYEVIT